MQKATLVIVLLCAVGVKGWWRMVWNDEFNGPSINRTKWQNEVNCGGGGNNEQQCYVADAANSYIQNGSLVIKAIQGWHTGSQNGCTDSSGCTNTLPYTSARLRTMMDPQGSWTGGRFEISAQLPDGAFLWPAIWMLPQTSAYGGWAASGEIDIMEMRGQNLYSYSTTLHYGGAWPNNHYWGQDHGTPDLSQGYHQWALEWTVGSKMDFYFDGNWVQSYPLTQWYWDGSWGSPNPYSAAGQPWDKPFYMILNMAVGGNFFNGMGSMAGNQGSLWRQNTLSVDYVRVYQWDTSVPTTMAVTTEAVTTEAVSTQAMSTKAVTTEGMSTQAAVFPPGTTAGPVGTTGEPAGQTTTGQGSPIQTDTEGTTTTGAVGSTESVSTTGTLDSDNSTQTNETTQGLPIEGSSGNRDNKASVQSSKKLSSGGEIGIIVAACICGGVLIAAAGYVIWKKRVQKSEQATVAVDDLVI